MPQSDDNIAQTELLIALGNQPGVSAWFAVWLLAARTRQPADKQQGDSRPCLNTTS